ncbi:DUF6572 domain-containing protein [Actinopolymorpha sp. B17G11]|uniref:DUF6572 domain-containing protein n=1 Tax=Actinopolymorpha sp. B17G11 TaxID=3160861 RepID=UPI0032E3E40F
MDFDPLKMDVISLSQDRAVAELHIVRDTPWTGTDDELNSFQAKVQTYVSYAMDGQMNAAYPETSGLPWMIVVTSYEGRPDERTTFVMDALQERLRAYGGSLTHRNVER